MTFIFYNVDGNVCSQIYVVLNLQMNPRAWPICRSMIHALRQRFQKELEGYISRTLSTYKKWMIHCSLNLAQNPE